MSLLIDEKYRYNHENSIHYIKLKETKKKSENSMALFVRIRTYIGVRIHIRYHSSYAYRLSSVKETCHYTILYYLINYALPTYYENE